MNSSLNLLINMDGAKTRLAHFAEQAESAGVSFERLPAVNGRALSEEEVQAHRDPGAIYPLEAGEIGLLLSHRRAWQRIYDSGKAWGVIFEDDACLKPETGALIEALPDDCKAATIINFEATNGEPVIVSRKASRYRDRDLYELRGVSLGTAMYAINRAGCAILLADKPQFAVSIDLYLTARRYGAIRGMKIFKVDPAPVIQADRLMPFEEAQALGLASTYTVRAKKLHSKLTFGKWLKREIYRIREQAFTVGAQKRIIPWG